MKTLPLGFDVIDDAVSDCHQIIEWLEHQNGWYRSHTGNEHTVSDMRTSDTYDFPFASYALPDCVAAMNKRMWQEMDRYAKQWNFSFLSIENVSVQRYYAASKQRYAYHHDSFSGSHRIVSGIVYLNDVEGGETYFPHFDFRVIPKEGRLALFPSNFIYGHEALAPKNGVKYAAAFWARY